MKITFLLTSCIICHDRAKESNFNSYERLEQTLTSINTIRTKFPESTIVLVDGSDYSLLDFDEQIVSSVNQFIDLSSNKELKKRHRQREFKARGEALLLSESLRLLQSQEHNDNDLIIKLSGRYCLNNSFNLEEHREPGKYTFKNHIWFLKFWSSWYINTTCYSLKYSLIQEYLEFLDNIDEYGVDFGMEHAHYNFYIKNKDKFKLIESLGVEGISYTGMEVRS